MISIYQETLPWKSIRIALNSPLLFTSNNTHLFTTSKLASILCVILHTLCIVYLKKCLLGAVASVYPFFFYVLEMHWSHKGTS